MDYGGDRVVQGASSEEDFQLVPETGYTGRVSGFASCTTDYVDDGEVLQLAKASIFTNKTSIS